MTDRTYNGWANYATWRVCLEMFDGQTWKDYFGFRPSVQDLGLTLKDHVENLFYEVSDDRHDLMRSYALAFVQDVDWYEIARHLLEDEEIPDEVAE